MNDHTTRRSLRSAIYTRVSTDRGLEQDFNSLDAQREASEAYIKSQAHEGWRLIRDHYDDGGFSGGSMDRPALQKLLVDVQARRIDVIVVYKVDRLTRSLADFAKLVETFDAHGVFFVSVTQSFNTTSSMGRLTLNVLLSFAQFEREVTGERIRDKIAASKKKGMWMGGVVPLGYRVEDRALHIVEDHAAIVRSLFRRYLESGSVVRLKQQLDAESFRVPIRIDGGGRSTGGGLFSRGHVYKLLSNAIYVGRIAHKGQSYEGHHPPIVTLGLWDGVQQSLRDHLGAATTKRTRQSSDALLAGKLYDDGGNRMSPTWARKESKRWRYYVSQAALQGDKSKAGSILRVPAADVETLVTEALGKLSPDRAASSTDIRNLIDRVVIGRATIRIQLSEVAAENDSPRVLTLPWTRPSPYRKREIIQGANDAKTYARPMPANARAILIEALRDAHRWLDELLSDPRLTLESLTSREDKSERSIRMTLSLAFLAPEIVKAAVEGRLPRGFGLKRLVDLTMGAGRISGARSGSGASARVRNDPPLLLSSRDGLSHPSAPGAREQTIRRPMPLGRPTEIQKFPRTACDLATLLWREQLWKRKFAARDFRPNAPEMSRGDGRKDSTDRLTPPQAAGMSCYSVAEEIIPGRADFLVELRGFEPVALALRASARI
jgi:site-specific DNA recombinase